MIVLKSNSDLALSSGPVDSEKVHPLELMKANPENCKQNG